VEIKCQLGATEVFIADLIAYLGLLLGVSSTHLVTNLDNTRHLRLRTQNT